MKIFLMICVVGICSFVGYGISFSYTDRKLFFYEFVNFINNLKNEIGFSMSKLPATITKLSNQIKNKQLNKILTNYLSCLKEKKPIEDKLLFKDIGILKQQEKDCTFDFFYRLGKMDLMHQVDALNSSIKIFEEYYSQAKSEAIKYCPLYTKLGILIGLFFILIVA